MSQTVQAGPLALIESVVRRMHPSAQDDARQLFRDIFLGNLTALSPGGNLLQFGGAKAGGAAHPVGVTHTVTGGSGVATVQISNPPTPQGQAIWHEVSYSPVVSFKSNSTVTHPPTTDTNITIPNSGVAAYYRLRSSFDKKTWSPYQQAQLSPVDAGLVESGALSAGAAFNQTNYAVVNSPGVGTDALITISGTGGPFVPYTAIKGSKQSLRPSATIVGSVPGFDIFAGWDGRQYQLKSSLAEVLGDDLEPVGKVTIGNPPPGGGGTTGGNGGRLTAV